MTRAILLLLFLFSPTVGLADQRACEALLARAIAAKPEIYSELSKESRDFLTQMLLPLVGRRGLEAASGFRNCRFESSCLKLPASEFATSKDLEVEWVSSGEPSLEVSDAARTLKIPLGFDLGTLPDGGRGLIKQWLVGSPLHPFAYSPSADADKAAFGESESTRKDVQDEALNAARASLHKGERKFLLVAPTGVGKTQVIVDFLDQRLSTPNGDRRLYLVVADQLVLLDQLAADLKSLKSPHRLLRWGGEFGSRSIPELLQLSKSSDVPVVLVTSIQSLKARIEDAAVRTGFENVMNEMRGVLSTFVFDEAHHLGATEAKQLVGELIDNAKSKAVLFGTTATPVHREVGIQELFDNQAFWAYLDTSESYMKRSHPFERPIEAVMDQLALAIDAGDITPFNSVHFLTPDQFGVPDFESMYTPIDEKDIDESERDTSTRYRIDPENYLEIAAQLEPLFEKHQQGFITVGTIREAEDLARFFNEVFHKKFSVFHSKMDRRDLRNIIDSFRKKEIQFLVSVRKLDEGINFPELSLYVDLNRTVGARLMLQRIGRLLRLAEGKEDVDIVMMVDPREGDVREMLSFMDRQIQNSFSGQRRLIGSKSEARKKELAELINLRTEVYDFWQKKISGEYVPYQAAKEWAKARQIRNGREWLRQGRAGQFPPNIPVYPQTVYRDSGWEGWPIFLGSPEGWRGAIEKWDYQRASDWVRSHAVQSSVEYKRLADAGELPPELPIQPHSAYKGEGWVNWYTFLGVEKQPRRKASEIWPFERAREWAQTHDIWDGKAWETLSKAGGLPRSVPAQPEMFYKDCWRGWSDFLGHETTMLPYEEAKTWARGQNIKASKQWQDLPRVIRKRARVPANPAVVYRSKGWTSWSDFLGTTVEYMSYTDASRWAQEHGIKFAKDWEALVKAGSLPPNLPATPWKAYKNSGWTSWGDFLGTGFATPIRKAKMATYMESQEWAQREGIQSGDEWREAIKKGRKPQNVPSAPDQAYKGSGWISWGEFLRTGRVSIRRAKVPFAEARAWAQKQGIRSPEHWAALAKEQMLPPDIPTRPEQVYERTGWTNWNDFLGNRQFLDFESARAWARTQGMRSSSEWKRFCEEGHCPENVPSNPGLTYWSHGWNGWRDFLNSGRPLPKGRKFWSYDKAREWVQEAGIKSQNEFRDALKRRELPLEIPSLPWRVYKDQWQGFGPFLGTRQGIRKSEDMVSYEQAKAWAKENNIRSSTQWRQLSRRGQLPENLPFEPERIYRDSGWEGWPKFLGKSE